MVCGDQGRLRHVDRRSWGHAVAGQEGGDRREHRGVEGRVRGMAILRLAPQRYRAIHAASGQPTRLQVGALLRARALAHAEGHVLRFGTRVITPETACSRLNVHLAACHATPCSGPDGTGRHELHGAHVGEAIEDASPGLVVQSGWRAGRAEASRGVLVRQQRFQTTPRTAATACLQHEAEPDRPGVHVHLGGHAVIDQPDEVTLVSGGFDHREMCQGEVMPGALLRTTGCSASPPERATATHGYGLSPATRPSESTRCPSTAGCGM